MKSTSTCLAYGVGIADDFADTIAPSACARRAAVVCVALLLCALCHEASATIFTLSDNNSSASFNTATQNGVFSWSVDGTSQLAQQWFWFRVGNAAEQSIDTLPIMTQGTTDVNFDGFPDTLLTRYNGGAFQIQLRYSLDGGTLGSGGSDMGEQIAITNSSGSPLAFHFFQYSDFDLDGATNLDSAYFANSSAVVQTNGTSRLTETVVTPMASHREIDLFPNTLLRLNDGAPTTLSDTPLGTVIGPGDVTWAYQWDVVIAPGATFQISKDKNITPVPEPSTAVLVVISMAALAGIRLLRRRS